MKPEKTLFHPALLAVFILLLSCSEYHRSDEADAKVRVPVIVTGIKMMNMSDYMELFATSRFLNKAALNSPVNGYVEEVSCNPGDYIKRGSVLFTLRTKEAEALRNDTLNKLYFPGLITVKASIDGMVISINHPKGDYVMEGETLGTISVPSSFVFILDVPYEATQYIKPNMNCEIHLPDGDTIAGMVRSRLPSMSEGPQTQQYIVQPGNPQNIPENLIAKVRVVKTAHENARALPQACVLSDEVMQNFWVMKLINDSTAVKEGIRTGLINGNMVEITEPVFSLEDRFLATGNYGVGDTIQVEIKGRLADN
jgi:hypothetical protein